MIEIWNTIKENPHFKKTVRTGSAFWTSILLTCSPVQPGGTPPPTELPHFPAPRPTEIILPTPTPIRINTPTPQPIRIFPPIPTAVRRESTPVIPSSAQDNRNRDLIVEGENGEILVLNDVLIGNIFRTPWENREAYVTVINTVMGGADQMIGIGLSTDCVFDRLRERRDLGNPIVPGLGAWTPNKRIDQLTVEVLLSSSANPAIVNAKKLVDRGIEKNCLEITALQRLKEQISRIRWNEMPRDIGKLAGWIAAEFIRGIREGISSGTPTPTPTPRQGRFPNLPRIPNPFNR